MLTSSNCAVYGCSNDSRYPRKPKFRLHRFPVKDEALLEKWVAACRTDEVNIYLAQICSDHFTQTDFDPELQGREFKGLTRLRPTAVPTLNLPEKPSIKMCAVDGCIQGSRPNMKHFRFPQEKDIRKKWIRSCGTRDKIDLDSATVCEKHFSRKQIVTKLGYESKNSDITKKVRRLKKDAIPDINLPGNTSESAPQDAAKNDVGLNPFRTVAVPWAHDASETLEPTLETPRDIKVCAVSGCNQGGIPNKKHYSIPKKKNVREIWIHRCGIRDDIDPDSATVCWKHFSRKQLFSKLVYTTEDDSILTKVRKLKKDGVPDMNLPKNIDEPALEDTAENGNAPQEKDIHDKKVQSCGTRDNLDTDNATLCEKQIVTKLEYKSKRRHIPRKVKRLKKDATPDISLPGNTSESAPQDTAENGVALDPCKAVPHPGEQDTPETQDDMEVTDEQVLQEIQEYRDLQEQEQQLKEELEAMDQKLMVSSLTSISLDDRKTRLCTGLPSLAVFTWLIDLLSGHLATFDCISKPDQLLITLMKLRLSLSTQDLAFRFNTSTQAIENILSDAIPIMACKLDFLICWPVRTHPRNIPRPFKPNFKNCSVIIDCLEFPTEKPLNITAESQTWSDIKHQTTIKCLVGITPYGSFSYVSQCWGGRITDRELVLVSGVLEHVYRGDMVITCKDFSIQQELSEKRAKLIVLESLDSPEKLISDHELATVSLFIEKAFKRIKRYKILSQTLPIPLLPYINEVLTCCLAFSNLQPKFQ
ncbi:uncharacterized protein LOC126988733 isoform X3 [Eriocheir sinensis]|uniref:uncharacterized protein LOC126988733 isoform X3 n=1 Tax=Eriocheir sinensis TaxID=95602 RepID=UPI0021C830A6|nr:uncharacterized protein LOC126988733 isoform X3 [Eriocheir sinensis]